MAPPPHWSMKSADRDAWARVSRSKWAVVREAALARDGYACVRCGAPAQEVDHRVPISQGGDFYDLDGLDSLCRACHKAKSLAERPVNESYQRWLDEVPGRREWQEFMRGL